MGFRCVVPASLDEALALLFDYRDAAQPIAGGTNLLVDTRHGRKQVSVVVDLSRLPLRYAAAADGWVRLGALTTVADLLKHPVLAGPGSVLHPAAASFAAPIVRNRATVAGNLVDASPAADLAPPLIALGAVVTLQSRQGTRQVPAEAFAVGVRRTARQPDELVTEIAFPQPAAGEYGEYFKLALRQAMAISVVSGAVVLAMDGPRCRQARIALGAVAPAPVRARHVEAALAGQVLTDAVVWAAAAEVVRDITPISDVRATAEYRTWIAETKVRRAVLAAATRAAEGVA